MFSSIISSNYSKLEPISDKLSNIELAIIEIISFIFNIKELEIVKYCSIYFIQIKLFKWTYQVKYFPFMQSDYNINSSYKDLLLCYKILINY